MRHLESQKRTMQVKHGLLKVHFLNLSHEMTQRRLEQLSDMAQVPALAKLGPPRRSLQPILLSEGADTASEHEVKCVRHLLEGGLVVLQFEVRNRVKGRGSIDRVLVRVSPADDDLYSVDTEIELPFLPYGSTGSCYAVLRAQRQTMGTVVSSFSCDLLYDDHVNPLLNFELSSDS